MVTLLKTKVNSIQEQTWPYSFFFVISRFRERTSLWYVGVWLFGTFFGCGSLPRPRPVTRGTARRLYQNIAATHHKFAHPSPKPTFGAHVRAQLATMPHIAGHLPVWPTCGNFNCWVRFCIYIAPAFC